MFFFWEFPWETVTIRPSRRPSLCVGIQAVEACQSWHHPFKHVKIVFLKKMSKVNPSKKRCYVVKKKQTCGPRVRANNLCISLSPRWDSKFDEVNYRRTQWIKNASVARWASRHGFWSMAIYHSSVNQHEVMHSLTGAKRREFSGMIHNNYQ